MSLLEAARAEELGGQPLCSVARLRAAPPPGLTAAEIDEALGSDVTSAAISRALAKHFGVRVAEHAISRHRRGDCRCGPPGSRAG